VARSRKHCSHVNVTIRSLFIVAGKYIVNNRNVFGVVMERQQMVFLHCCRAGKYFICMLTGISGTYCECVFVALGIHHARRMRGVKLSYVASLALVA
jgi:hypothetical protein